VCVRFVFIQGDRGGFYMYSILLLPVLVFSLLAFLCVFWSRLFFEAGVVVVVVVAVVH
jgi:hypothetical protein